MLEGERIHAAPSGVKLTYDDFLLFPDDGKRHELIDGEHFVSPSPGTKHQQVSVNLTAAIFNWLDEHAIGRVFHAPFDIVLSLFDVVVPDLVYISNARLSVLTDRHMAGAPDLVVEIASQGTRRRDATRKLRLYERCGVEEYWIVDPRTQVVRIRRRSTQRFGAAVELVCADGDVLTTPLLPGFLLPLHRIFKNV